MTDKPDLVVLHRDPVQDLPNGCLEDFLAWIQIDGERTSSALRKVVEKYELSSLDFSNTLHFIKTAYPKLDLMEEAFRSKIIDSGYPNVINCSMTDEEFDNTINRLKDGPQ